MSDDCDITITEESITNAILKQSVGKAIGSDCIPVFLHHCIVDYTVKPLCHLYNLSLSSQCFPDCWKLSHVIPVPKCKNPTINELRPISLLHFFGKVFERLVFAHVKPVLESHFGFNQFGFKSNSSTAAALITLHNFITEKLDSASVKGVQLFALDLSRAFDTLRHNIIVQRLIDCNLQSYFINWIASKLL